MCSMSLRCLYSSCSSSEDSCLMFFFDGDRLIGIVSRNVSETSETSLYSSSLEMIVRALVEMVFLLALERAGIEMLST